MRKVLVLLFQFVVLLTTTTTISGASLSLKLPILSLPAIAQPSASLINFTTIIPRRHLTDELTSSLLFGVISDIHVQNTNFVAQSKFQQMLADMVQIQVPNLVINGDIGDGNPLDYDILATLVNQQKNHPTIYYTIGNHEFYKAYHNQVTNAWSPQTFPNGETDVAALNRFLNFSKRSHVYFDEYLNSYHFIFLGSEESAISDPANGDRAYLSEVQLSWLELKLKENFIPGKPIFVFLHQPLVRLGSTLNTSDYVIQADRLRLILNQFPEVIFFSGHIHRQLELPTTVLKQKFVMVNSSSVYLPRAANGQGLPNKSEGLVVQVFNNEVMINGRDFLSKTWIPGTQYEFNY